MNETILADLTEISSQLSFSLRMMSASFEDAVAGSIGSPEVANPKICMLSEA
jgi:hypothetical protein